jgi:hypothetical protein
MGLVSQNDTWRYLKCPLVDMLADDQPVSVPAFSHDGDVGRGYVLEKLMARWGVPDVERLADARKIEIRICRDEYSVPPAGIAEIRHFISARADALTRRAVTGEPTQTSR